MSLVVIKKNDFSKVRIELGGEIPYTVQKSRIESKCLSIVSNINDLLSVMVHYNDNSLFGDMVLDLFNNSSCEKYSYIEKFIFHNNIQSITYNNKTINFYYFHLFYDLYTIRNFSYYLDL